jgi:Na+/melibiose symporter-like transporter
MSQKVGVTPEPTASTPWSAQDGWRYGLLGLPLAFCAIPLYVLMPNLYAREWGVSLSALGAVLLGARLLDALIDPQLGALCVRLYATSLRAVLAMGTGAAMALALGFSALLVPAVHEPDALLWWAGFWLIVTYGAYSALTVAHQSWGAMLGGDALYRSRVVAWREGLGLAGVLLAVVTPTLLGVPVTLALLYAGLALGVWAWRRAPQPVQHPHPAVVGAVWLPWRHSEFRRLFGVYMINGIASAIPATLVLFFVQDLLQASEAIGAAALGVYFVAGAASMPLWLRLVNRWGLAESWRFGMILSTAVFLGASFLGAGDAAWFLLVCALSGVALGSDLVIPSALLAGVIAQRGERGQAEGAYFGWWNFATKLNLALAAGLSLPMLGWLGYVPGTRNANSAAWLTLAYCIVPCALKTLASIALHFFVIQAGRSAPRD